MSIINTQCTHSLICITENLQKQTSGSRVINLLLKCLDQVVSGVANHRGIKLLNYLYYLYVANLLLAARVASQMSAAPKASKRG